MANQPTEKCSYPSKFSPGKFVTAAQYICEIICERKALSELSNLPTRFWQLDKWAKYYRQQIPSAHKLLKQFSAMAVIRALAHWKAKKIYSLRAPHLIPLCEQAEKEVDLEIKKMWENNVISRETEIELTFRQPRSEPSKKTILSKLKELDE